MEPETPVPYSQQPAITDCHLLHPVHITKANEHGSRASSTPA
jgi:hypothetical protein